MDLHKLLEKKFTDSVELIAAGGDDAVDGVQPEIVAAPKDEAAAQALVAWCGQEKIAVVPRGGSSKIGWGAPPRQCQLILSSRHLNQVTDHDVGNATVTAQSGIALAELEQQMRTQGQYLPLDFRSHPGATLGGVVATNHSGATRLSYRTPRDMVVGMKAVLSDGRLINTGSKVVKNVSGYDLAKLFVGSYGTMGFITSVTLRLRPCEEQSSWWHQAYNSWDEAAAMAAQINSSQFEPALLRISAAKSTFQLMARFDGIAESVQDQLQQLPPSEAEPLTPHHASENGSVELYGQLPLTQALDFAQEAQAAGAAQVQWDTALGVVQARWDKASDAVELVRKLRELPAAKGGFVFIRKAPIKQKTAELVWGETRADFALHQQLKHRFDGAGVFAPGRFWGGI